MAKTVLVFLESQAQYDAFYAKRFVAASDEKIKFCALTPFALYLCRNSALDYFVPEDCFSQAEYTNCKNRSEQRILDLIPKLNRISVAAGKSKINFPLEIGNYFQVLLYILIQSLHHRSFLLQRAIEHINPSDVVVFRSSQPSQLYLDFLTLPNGNSYAEVAQLLTGDFNLNVLTYETNSGPDALFDKIRSFVRKYDFFYRLHSVIFKSVPSSLLFPLPGSNTVKDQKSALIVGPLYGFRRLLDASQITAKIRFAWTMAEFIPKENVCSPAEKLFTKDSLGWDDNFNGIPILSLIDSQMNIIESTMLHILKNFKRFKLKIEKFDLIVSAVFLFPLQYFLAHLAQNAGKKVIVWIHGEKGLVDQAQFDFAQDVQYATNVLTFGSGASRYYKQVASAHMKFNGPVSIGMASTDKLIGLTGDKKGYILYATGKYLLSISFMNSVMGPDNRLYHSQKTLLRYLSTQNHRPVIFKRNPTRYMGELPGDLLLLSAAPNIRTVQFEESYMDLLKGASAVILDTPGTASVETCGTHIPIFIVYNRNMFREEPLALLKKRAVVTTTPEELAEKIELYFRKNIYDADLNNDEYARAYGTHMNDGRSVERALEYFSGVAK